MAGTSWALALAVKDIINRPRPPASLWLIPPDSAASFPSGHDTTAIVVVLIVFMALAGTGRLRIAGTALAVVFALAVGASRVYLGDHYPTDVLGSYLTVAAAVLLASAVTNLLWVRRLAARLLRSPGIAPAPARNLPAAAGRGDQRRAAGVPVHRAAGDSQTLIIQDKQPHPSHDREFSVPLLLEGPGGSPSPP